MTGIPGSPGRRFIGDKSVTFYKENMAFIMKQIEKLQSRIFITRILNTPTVFVGSHQAAQSFLQHNSDDIVLGYEQLWKDIFGPNIIFMNGLEADETKRLLRLLFKNISIDHFPEIISEISQKYVSQLVVQIENPQCIYNSMKHFATEICLTIFLGIDFQKDRELAEHLIKLTISHWRGIISVPLNVSIPLKGQSSYGKADKARLEILQYLETFLENGSSTFIESAKSLFPDKESLLAHLLLFTCALIPKAVASILTSFIVKVGQSSELQEQMHVNPQLISAALLEVMRLWPPFLGGRRFVSKSFTLNDYVIPEGHCIVYVPFAAHRDPQKFSLPEEFLPERWLGDLQDRTAEKILIEDLLTLGYGPRQCMGNQLIWDILHNFCSTFVKKFGWESNDIVDSDFKYLPVVKPKQDVLVKLTLR